MRAISRMISMGLLSLGVTGLSAAALLVAPTAAEAAYGPTPCTPTVSISPSTIARGQTLTVTIGGNCFSQSFTVQIHSTTVTLGTVTTNASGAGSGTFTVPTTLPDGAHTVSVGNSIGDTATATLAVSGGPFTGTTTSSSGLPLTGTNAVMSVAVAAVVIAVGGMLVLTARRRRGARGIA